MYSPTRIGTLNVHWKGLKMASGHDFEPVTLNWDLAGQANESLAADILHNFHGRQLCDSEILDEHGVARPVFQAFTSSIQSAMLNKEWTRSQRSDQLQNGWGCSGNVLV